MIADDIDISQQLNYLLLRSCEHAGRDKADAAPRAPRALTLFPQAEFSPRRWEQHRPLIPDRDFYLQLRYRDVDCGPGPPGCAAAPYAPRDLLMSTEEAGRRVRRNSCKPLAEVLAGVQKKSVQRNLSLVGRVTEKSCRLLYGKSDKENRCAVHFTFRIADR